MMLRDLLKIITRSETLYVDWGNKEYVIKGSNSILEIEEKLPPEIKKNIWILRVEKLESFPESLKINITENIKKDF